MQKTSFATIPKFCFYVYLKTIKIKIIVDYSSVEYPWALFFNVLGSHTHADITAKYASFAIRERVILHRKRPAVIAILVA